VAHASDEAAANAGR